jgi:hypothetical protein
MLENKSPQNLILAAPIAGAVNEDERWHHPSDIFEEISAHPRAQSERDEIFLIELGAFANKHGRHVEKNMSKD